MSKQSNKVLRTLQQTWTDLARIDDGQGGNSWVFSGTAEDGVCLAIKVLRRLDRYDRFKKEVEAVRALHSETGIVRVLDFNMPESPKLLGDLRDLPYFTMPYYERGSLAGELRPVTDDGRDALSFFRRIARNVQLIHERDYAHRDLKPENVLLSLDGRPWLSDFGLCLELADQPGTLERQTASGEMVGSLLYRAPEYARGRLDNSDHRPGDIFALGRILWAILTGSVPSGMTDLEYRGQEIDRVVPTLRRPRLVQTIITESAAPDPRDRPSIQAIIDVVDAWGRDIDSEGSDVLARVARELVEHPRILDRRKHEKLYAEKRVSIDGLSAAILAQLKESELATRLGEALPGSLEVDDRARLFSELDARKPNIEACPGLRFNAGDVEVIPLIMVQCPIARAGAKGYEAQALAAAVGAGGVIQGPEGPVRGFRTPNQTTLIQLQADVRNLLDWLVEIVGTQTG